jgi:acetyl esterase/lipase
LDIYPAPEGGDHNAGTVIYLHGGGFVSGNRTMDAGRVHALALHGLNVVVPDYRPAPTAVFPDQVTDVRAAVTWVRERLDEIGTANPHIGLWGASAGAVLAGLAALTGVQAVASWFGFSDITTSAARSPLENDILPPGPECAFLGVDRVTRVPDLACAASPIHHVHADAPPFLIAHGDRDQVVNIRESRQLHDALTRAAARSTFVVLGGAGHEDPRFDEPDMIAMTAAFFHSHLSRPLRTQISTDSRRSQ